MTTQDDVLYQEFVKFLEDRGMVATVATFEKEWSAHLAAKAAAAAAANGAPAPANDDNAEANATSSAPATPLAPSTPPAAKVIMSPVKEDIAPIRTEPETTANPEDELWDCEDAEGFISPEFVNGAGVSKEEFDLSRTNEVKFTHVSPYQKAPPPEGGQLESFDVRVIYESGKTGFEDNKDFPINVGSVIAGRYQVVEYLGSAAFSRAIQCIDLKHNHNVCMKIIRNTKDFFDQALDEIKLLQLINCSGDPDENKVLQLYDYFYYKEHLFLVCELLRDNLYEFAKFNREEEAEFYFTLPRIQAIARQVLRALTFIHSLNLLHCDLKPENILIKSYSRCEIKVIDFGSSCYTSDRLSSYIQSRSYRAPEVVIGCHYDGKIDVWSLGAILVELMTGQVLFSGQTLPEMLSRIASICGPFSQRMLHEGRHACHFITKHGVFYERNDNNALVFHYTTDTPLRSVVPSDDEVFLDFIEKCLKVDPVERFNAQQLLEHPFLAKDYGEVFSSPPPLRAGTSQ